MSRSGRKGASAGGQKGAFGGSAAQACPFFAWTRNFTVAVRKGLKDTTSTHRTSGSIFPRPPRALFQPCSRGLGRAQRGGMPAPSRAHKARGRLAFSTGPDADTSGRARALGPWCPLPLACSIVSFVRFCQVTRALIHHIAEFLPCKNCKVDEIID